MKEYRPRLVDGELQDALEAFGAVLISGPKWSGKTTTAMRVANSVLRMQDPRTKASNKALAKIDPFVLLEGERPRLIDEWQEAPELWDAIRLSVDDEDSEGMYIMTGSVNVDESSIDHSGTGRIYRMSMGTMSLHESGDSTGEVSVRDMLDGSSPRGSNDLSVRNLSRLIIRGGWPRSVGKSDTVARTIIKGYCRSIINTEVQEVDGVKKDEHRMTALMRALSRGISQPVSKTALMGDMSSIEGVSITLNTLNAYMSALRRICVLEEMPAWNPNLRSKTAIRTAETLHFCDPAIAAHYLYPSVDGLLGDLNTMGLLFESLVVRDLRAYVRSIGGEVFHYRDANGAEADAVLRMDDGRWALVEVKLGHDGVETGARGLVKVRDKIDTSGMGEPAFMAVVTGTGRAYTREDGVHVIPIGCLRD